MEPMVRIELTTYCLRNNCSTTELHRRGAGDPGSSAPGSPLPVLMAFRWPRRPLPPYYTGMARIIAVYTLALLVAATAAALADQNATYTGPESTSEKAF